MADVRTALAPTFTLDTAETFELTFSAGPSPVTVTVPARDYRMVLAPSSGSTRDYVRAMTVAINAGLASAARSETALVAIDPTTCEVTLSIPTATWSATEVTGYPLRRLGFGTSIATVIENAYGVRPVLYLATFVERVHAGWQSRIVASQGETLAGVPYGITSGVSRAEDEIALGFVPRDPAIRAEISAPQTALNPDGAYVGSLGAPAAREWSVLDVVAASVGQPVAFALGNWLTVSSSTSERYDLGAIRGESLAAPRIERVRDGWDRYYRITLGVLRSSTGTRT